MASEHSNSLGYDERSEWVLRQRIAELEQQLAQAQQEARMWKGQYESKWAELTKYMDENAQARALLEEVAPLLGNATFHLSANEYHRQLWVSKYRVFLAQKEPSDG